MAAARPLPGLPPYGPPALSFPEANAFREGFVVEFTQSDGRKWIGNFASETKADLTEVHTELGTRAIVVISGGVGYLVDAENQRMVRELGWGIEHLAFIGELGVMVTSNGLWLEAFDANKVIWQSRRFSWDGVRNIVRSGLNLTGEAYDPMGANWIPFHASLATGEVDGGSYNGPD